MRVGIIGLGYVGLTLAIVAADSGIDVYGIEINPHIRECLENNRAHFFEPGLDELIARHNGKRFHFGEQFPQDIPFDLFIITVGTPLRTGEKLPNFDYIKSALDALQSVYAGSELVILRSTVSVGTTRNVVLPYLSNLCGKLEEELLIGMCPERTVEGKAVEELRTLPQIISGNNGQALAAGRNFFERITPNIVPVSSLEEAELVKLYCNTYRDMAFAIGNAFCLAAQSFGVDGVSAIRNANQGYIRSNIALPGFVAGPCLEKDAYILTFNLPDCPSKDLILRCRKLNESLEDAVVQWVRQRLGPPAPGKVVVLSGMAFKGRPETSDLRGSSSVRIGEKLSKLGYILRLHDYVVHPQDLAALQIGDVYAELSRACEGASLLLILNNHKKYEMLQNELSQLETTADFAVLDVWGVCDRENCIPGMEITTIGNLRMERIGGAS